jgi:uncharacterized protein RhaS with RHS repeats
VASHRFVSEDPSGFNGGLNLYAYVGGNPLGYVDPSGLSGERSGMGTAARVGLAAAGAALLAFDVANTFLGAVGPDTGIMGAPMLAAGVTGMRGAALAGGGYRSFSALKRALGSPGAGNQWHHVVEQSQVGKFGASAIHNVDNVVAVPTSVHQQISAYYSSKFPFTGGKTVRQWLSGQSFDQQRDFGLQVLRDFGVSP